MVPGSLPVTWKSMSWRRMFDDTWPMREASCGWAAPAAASAVSPATSSVQTLTGWPAISTPAVERRPTSRTSTGVPGWEMPSAGTEIAAVMSAPPGVFAAATVASITRTSDALRLLPVQVATGVPAPLPVPFATLAVVQVTPVTTPFVNTTDAVNAPVATGVVFSTSTV